MLNIPFLLQYVMELISINLLDYNKKNLMFRFLLISVKNLHLTFLVLCQHCLLIFVVIFLFFNGCLCLFNYYNHFQLVFLLLRKPRAVWALSLHRSEELCTGSDRKALPQLHGNEV